MTKVTQIKSLTEQEAKRGFVVIQDVRDDDELFLSNSGKAAFFNKPNGGTFWAPVSLLRKMDRTSAERCFGGFQITLPMWFLMKNDIQF